MALRGAATARRLAYPKHLNPTAFVLADRVRSGGVDGRFLRVLSAYHQAHVINIHIGTKLGHVVSIRSGPRIAECLRRLVVPIRAGGNADISIEFNRLDNVR